MIVPAGFATVTPYLGIRAADRYLAFLRTAFDAVELGRTVDEGGWIRHAEVRIGSSILMLYESQDNPPSRSAFYLFTENAERTVMRALDAGCSLEMPVAEIGHGERQGGVRDPAGMVWWVSEHLALQARQL